MTVVYDASADFIFIGGQENYGEIVSTEFIFLNYT